MDISNTDNGIRMIETARDLKTMNNFVKKGHQLLFKKVVPSDEIRTKYSVWQHKQTKEVKVLHDFREEFDKEIEDLYESVIPWTFHYPYAFELPFAAYLIPKDLAIGEIVFLMDIIEDIKSRVWNQGDSFRLQYGNAIWNGSDFEIQFNPDKDTSFSVG